MYRKASLLITSALLLSASFALAQSFEINPNPSYDTTSGVPPYNGSQGGHQYVEMKVDVKNISFNPITFSWRNITDTTQNPSGWILVGVCDNIQCRAEGGSWYFGDPQQSNPVASGMVMDPKMAVHVYAPDNGPDGTGVYKIELSGGHQTDTAVFILTKNSNTGISAIQINDKRVSIYPNPIAADGMLQVYIDKNLHAANATIYNIIGRAQMTLPVAQNKELNAFNVNKLPAGLYILRLADQNGNIITSRKFSKR